MITIRMSGDNKVTNLSGLRNILNMANNLENDDNDNEENSGGSIPDDQFNINYDEVTAPVKRKAKPSILDEISKSEDSGASKSASVSMVKGKVDKRPTLPLAPGEKSSGSEVDESEEQGSVEESEGSRSHSRSASQSVSVVGTPKRGRSRSRQDRSASIPRRDKIKMLSQEEIMLEKQKIILEFARLEKRGVTFTKHFTLNSDLNEMKFELMKSKKVFQLERDLKIARNLLWNGAKVITFGSNLLSKYTPIDLELEGWPDELKSNIYDYDDVLEKLIEKYKSKVDAPPEIQLGYMLLSSAIQYSAANKVPKVFAKMMGVRNQEYDPSQSFENNINKMETTAKGPIRGPPPGHINPDKNMVGPEDDPEMAEIMREINAEKKNYPK